jgi:CheY-like chemotaxis protein
MPQAILAGHCDTTCRAGQDGQHRVDAHACQVAVHVRLQHALRTMTPSAHRSGAAMHATARVIAVDDHAPFLEVLGGLLRAAKHLDSVGEATSGEHGVALAQELRPDMAIIDVRMRGMDGVEAAERVKEIQPSTLVLLISSAHPAELPRECHTVADAVLWKSDLEPGLLDELWLRHNDRN